MIMGWFSLVCHVFQLFGGVHVQFRGGSVRGIMVQQLVACDQVVVQVWFSCGLCWSIGMQSVLLVV